MTNFGDLGDFELESMLSDLKQFQDSLAETAQQVAQQTADAWSPDKLAHVWVNANGVVIQVEFDDSDYPDASSSEVAEAVVAASQAAAAQMQAQVQRLQADALAQASSTFGDALVPSIVDLPEMPDLRPDVPLSAPNSRERQRLSRHESPSQDDDDNGLRLRD